MATWRDMLPFVEGEPGLSYEKNVELVQWREDQLRSRSIACGSEIFGMALSLSRVFGHSTLAHSRHVSERYGARSDVGADHWAQWPAERFDGVEPRSGGGKQGRRLGARVRVRGG